MYWRIVYLCYSNLLSLLLCKNSKFDCKRPIWVLLLFFFLMVAGLCNFNFLFSSFILSFLTSLCIMSVAYFRKIGRQLFTTTRNRSTLLRTNKRQATFSTQTQFRLQSKQHNNIKTTSQFSRRSFYTVKVMQSDLSYMYIVYIHTHTNTQTNKTIKTQKNLSI